MAHRSVLVLLLCLVSTALASCGWMVGCGFDEATYTQLKRGLSQHDVAELTGCRGMSTSPPSGKPKESMYRAWSGPRGSVTVEFVKDQVESRNVGSTNVQ